MPLKTTCKVPPISQDTPTARSLIVILELSCCYKYNKDGIPKHSFLDFDASCPRVEVPLEQGTHEDLASLSW